MIGEQLADRMRLLHPRVAAELLGPPQDLVVLVQHARGEAGVRYLRREQLLLGEVLPPRPEQEREEAGDDGGDVLFGGPAQPERVHERDVVVAGERGELRAALHAASSPRVAIHGVR